MKNGTDRGREVSEKDPKSGLLGEKSFVETTWGGAKMAVWGSFAAVIFGVVILVASIMAAANPIRVYPHEWEGTATVAAKIEYYLPYPGILPDNPLFKLKAIRDRVGLWLTRKGEDKAKRELFLADKRINAAVFLVEGGKETLGVSTATKAEKYLEAAVNRATKLSKEGKDVKSLLNTLIQASAKHEQILAGLQESVRGGDKDVVAETRRAVRMLHQRVEQAVLEAK